jgi:hypothetical protein
MASFSNTGTTSKHVGNYSNNSTISGPLELSDALIVNGVPIYFPADAGDPGDVLATDGNFNTYWGGASFDGLDGVNITNPIVNDILKYDGADWINSVADASFVGLPSISETGGAVTIAADLNVQGTTTTIDSANLEVADNIIYINAGETGAGVSLGSAGIEVDRGSSTDYQILFDETVDLFKIGEIGSLQAVATRQNNPTDGYVAIWNDTESRFDTVNNLTNIVNLTASGTTTFNGAVITFPSNQGASGNILSTDGAGSTSWAYPNKWPILNYSSTTPLTLNDTHYLVNVSTTSNLTITLPDVVAFAGKFFTIKKISATGIITINRSGSDLINSTMTTLDVENQYDQISFVSNGNSTTPLWLIV